MFLDELIPALRPRRPTAAENLAHQLENLRREIRRVGSRVGHQAADNAGEWSDVAREFGREAARQGAFLAEEARHQALRGVDAVRRDPLPVIAVLGTVVLLARLLDRAR